MSPFDDTCITSYVMAIVLVPLAFTVYEIFSKKIKCQKFDLENEGQGQGGKKLELRIGLEMFDSIYVIVFRILATRQHTFMQKDTHIYTHAHIDTHVHNERQGDVYSQNLQSKASSALKWQARVSS